mgnify:CR=1 FL=1
MMEATFGLTALCDTENNGLLFPSSSSVSFALDKTDDDDDWSKEDGCATETNPLLLLLLPDDDEDDAPSLDLDPNMLAYLAARETVVVFGEHAGDAANVARLLGNNREIVVHEGRSPLDDLRAMVHVGILAVHGSSFSVLASVLRANDRQFVLSRIHISEPTRPY